MALPPNKLYKYLKTTPENIYGMLKAAHLLSVRGLLLKSRVIQLILDAKSQYQSERESAPQLQEGMAEIDYVAEALVRSKFLNKKAKLLAEQDLNR